MPSDEELKKTFKISGDTEGMLKLEFLAGVSDTASNVQQAELIDQHLKKIFNDNPEKNFKCLVDLSLISKNTHYPSPQARQIYSRMINYPPLKKIAAIVPSRLSQAVMNFVIQTTGQRGKIKLFRTGKEALDWLKK